MDNIKPTDPTGPMNQDKSKQSSFLKNEIPTFDSMREGVAWHVIKDVGQGSSYRMDYRAPQIAPGGNLREEEETADDV